ncbi:serine/threonine-protein kinase [Streptomyces sp. ZAF1911]|uniref:serine/threonine-protein kinase n=1 Tax=Streptomyces sp. ZAF1911 TaxID=2944129 RepID=UPI00237A5AC1|nr:serine/threonine-protein kinase [Streptomyces sp. ZAF1911]MDD9375618.1 serine/threonine-protein kinase [Streptomyces sp. ZAF1911]
MEEHRGLPEGSQVAGYRLEREVGRGDTSVVYRAKDLRLGRTVALKLISPELQRDDAFRRRLVRDTRIAAAIDHPNILPIFEADETDGVLYFAMRYVPGPDLRVVLDQEGPLPVATALRIAAQVASALDAAHEHDLVHRDVKPANILVAGGADGDHPEHVYLTDFGLTQESLSHRTLDYMAPEQISGSPVDGRCDLYSLACVVYETIAGGPPFERGGDMALLWAHQYDPPPALSERRPGIAPGVDAVMAKALAKRPEDRYASCLEFVAALRSAASPDPTSMHPPSHASMPDPIPPPASPSFPLGGSNESTPPGPPFDDDDDEW